ncbi:MAG TPA: 4'-phosphopantetheinyl transferase superfamily protein [Chitinophagaceae bacterium]|nr:4'-phosphopantetheinyl transferase superfamily protein [Chitinophagaceae bacterium]HNA92357.1 4'-phosphopantetheinyl transferase superfamily protein [Chitinophagaceae bacterium]HNA97218.1 4'-phosphopantetheinyl transferase superfamily protein [Chitinophagaceae bacterium]HNC38396.1 4'-phosphopantetheinyl transferase superfamily protein [Chitinophagaceae bacterium]HND95538.1 4'-phosphopantetheinyl transferase superfamily protein [Chitinophagaceae bacterium]
MPIFFQHQINEFTRLGVWKIEETEDFFKRNVPAHRDVTHPHKRLQHLAGRFLLQFLFPDFPYDLIQIADTRKPFLPDERYHFSISHCGDFAAAIVSSKNRVGVDVEEPKEKILSIVNKFISAQEKNIFGIDDISTTGTNFRTPTLIWSAKESVFKWYGEGAVDFKQHIQLASCKQSEEAITCFFAKTHTALAIEYRIFDELVLTWVVGDI